MIAVCRNCGKPVARNARKCSLCGALRPDKLRGHHSGLTVGMIIGVGFMLLATLRMLVALLLL